MLFLFGGLVFMVAGGYGFLKSRHLARAGLRADAEVVDLYERHDGESGRVYYPIVRFWAADGQEVVTRTRSGGSPPPARPGDRVRVVYQPGSPQVVSIDTVRGRGTVLTGLIFIVGLGMIALDVYNMTR